MKEKKRFIITGLGIYLAMAAMMAAMLVFGFGVNAQDVPEQISYQGRLLDSAGQPVNDMSVTMDFSLWDIAVTQEPVVDEMISMGGTADNPISSQDLVPGSELVTGAGGTPIYETPRDYLIDYAVGSITRVPTGFILDGQTVEVDFDWVNSGVQLWSESQTVEVQQGLYGVMLGSSVSVPASLFNAPSVFLEVSIAGETLTPRRPLTSVPFAMNASLLGGLSASQFADFGHAHDFAQLLGEVDDSQIPDDITVFFAADSDLLDGLQGEDYVQVAGDTVTGDLQVDGDLLIGRFLTVNADASVLGGNLALGRTLSKSYGIINNQTSAPSYGGLLYGVNYGVRGTWSGSADHYGTLGMESTGVEGLAGNSAESSTRYGGLFTAHTQHFAYGVKATGYGYGNRPTYGVYGYALNSATADAYGGYFIAPVSGSGDHYGVSGNAMSSDQDAYGVYGVAQSDGTTADIYGGYFSAGINDVGNNYGIYSTSYDIAGMFAYAGDPDTYNVELGTAGRGVTVNYGDSTGTSLRGMDMNLESSGFIIGLDIDIESYASLSGIYGINSSLGMKDNNAAGYGIYSFVHGGNGDGPQYGVNGIAYGFTAGNTYGVRGYALNSPGTAYGIYGDVGNASDYAGYFNTGKVRIGNFGTEDYATGSGDLFVADDIEVEDNIYVGDEVHMDELYYNTPQTRYYSVSLVGEWAGYYDGPWDPGLSYTECVDGVRCATYYPVNLPDRALVTAFRIWGSTASTSHDFDCVLRSNAMNSTSNGLMAWLYSDSTVMNLTDNTIENGSIDNENNWYSVCCYEAYSSRGATVRIYGMRIDYTVDGPE